ncbi:hypothetical protein OAQ50_04840, partial [Acidimicrobiia bacterium]|nr:hypothetical protein [Acidimicrobiia bacterium]
FNKRTKPSRTLPKSENSSRRIFSEKYDEGPAVENNPNFKNIENKVAKIPLIVTTFLVVSDVSTVIVQNNKIRAVATRARVGPITIQFNPIISDIVFNSILH